MLGQMRRFSAVIAVFLAVAAPVWADDNAEALIAVAEVKAEVGDVSGAQETLSLALQTAQTMEDAFLHSIALGEILKSSAALMPR